MANVSRLHNPGSEPKLTISGASHRIDRAFYAQSREHIVGECTFI